MSHALLAANGDFHLGTATHFLTQTPFDLIVAVDGGIKHLRTLHLTPHCVVGDLDSISVDDLNFAQKNGAEVLRFPSEKDETDLEIALKIVAKRGIKKVSVVGMIGDRFDQTLANVQLLALPEIESCDVQICDGQQLTRLLRKGKHHLCGHVGETISLLPLNGDVKDITTTGLKYPLNHETLKFGCARGVSNVLVQEKATLEIGDGQLLLVQTLQSAI